MEWLTSRGGASTSMEVDIGHMSRMELRSAAPSVNKNDTGISSDQLLTPMEDKLYANLLASFQWTDDNAMKEKEALDLLERTFYPFKEVRSKKESVSINHVMLLDSLLWILSSFSSSRTKERFGSYDHSLGCSRWSVMLRFRPDFTRNRYPMKPRSLRSASLSIQFSKVRPFSIYCVNILYRPGLWLSI